MVTPNLHEAGALTGREIKTLAQMKEAGRAIRELGPENVVIKGGHLESIAADVLYDGCEFTEFRAARIDTKNTHGPGCIFASAIAANLAPTAVEMKTRGNRKMATAPKRRHSIFMVLSTFLAGINLVTGISFFDLESGTIV